jgi:hypothetical protein
MTRHNSVPAAAAMMPLQVSMGPAQTTLGDHNGETTLGDHLGRTLVSQVSPAFLTVLETLGMRSWADALQWSTVAATKQP